MTDWEQQDAQAQAVLAELRSAEVPDVVDSSYQSQLAALGDHAQSAFNEVLAQYRFMGLVCGIKGPNGTDEEVKDARDAIMEAISDFLHPDGGPLSTQVSERYRQYLDLRNAPDLYDRFGIDEALIVQEAVQRIGSIGHPSDTASYAKGIVDGLRRPDMSRYLAAGDLSQAGADYINAAAVHYEEAVRLDLVRRELAAQRRREWWQGVWDGIRSYYDDNMELIRNGQWLLATGRIAIDAMVFAAEEVVITGLMAGIVAITGGLLAGVALALRAALRAAISVARLGTRSVRKITAHWDFKIELSKVEPGILYSNPIPVNVSVTRKLDYEQKINVETDLTPEEARAMGEGGQGSTRPDADEAEPADAPKRVLDDVDARWEKFHAAVSPEDIKLAASDEVSDAASKARKKVIAAYGEAYDGAATGNTAGMTYNRPIRVLEFPPPDQLVQWRMPDNTLTGNFFDPTGNSTPSQLGISSIGRTREVYVPQGRGLAIEGYGKDKYPDNWTVKNREEITEGGTPQWFIADQAKPLVEDMSASGMTWRDFAENKKWAEQPDGSFTSEEGRLTKDVFTVDNRNPPPPKITLTQWTLEPAE